MKRTTTLSLAAALMVTSALPLAAYADTGAYVGASIGNARLDDNFDGFGIDTDADAYRFQKTCRYSARAACSSGMPTYPSMDFRSTHPETTILIMAAG